MCIFCVFLWLGQLLYVLREPVVASWAALGGKLLCPFGENASGMERRVLVPYDGSNPAEAALDYALKAFPDSDLLILHVVEPFPDHGKAAGHPDRRSEQVFEESERLLEAAESRVSEQGRAVETQLRYGRPVHAILRAVEEQGIEEVVMGSHGRDGAARLLLGSVAETVVRRAPVPVTVVPPDEDGPHRDNEFGSPDEVLVPFDGSTCARRALEYALRRFPDASVTALYVIYPSVEEYEVIETEADLEAAIEEDEARRSPGDRESEHVLAIAKRTAGQRGRDVELASRAGDPERVLLEWIEEHGPDHVVMGCHGRDGLARILLGSVAETVVRRAPVPVTTVK